MAPNTFASMGWMRRDWKSAPLHFGAGRFGSRTRRVSDVFAADFPYEAFQVGLTEIVAAFRQAGCDDLREAHAREEPGPFPVIARFIGHEDDEVRVRFRGLLQGAVRVFEIPAGRSEVHEPFRVEVLDLAIAIHPDTGNLSSVLPERGTVVECHDALVIRHGSGRVYDDRNLLTLRTINDVGDDCRCLADRNDEFPAGEQRVCVWPLVPVIAERAPASGVVPVP